MPALEQQGQPQQHRRLRVQEVVPPVLGHELRHDDRDRLVGLAQAAMFSMYSSSGSSSSR